MYTYYTHSTALYANTNYFVFIVASVDSCCSSVSVATTLFICLFFMFKMNGSNPIPNAVSVIMSLKYLVTEVALSNIFPTDIAK